MHTHVRIAAVALIASLVTLLFAPTARADANVTRQGTPIPPGATPVHNEFHYQDEDSCGVPGLTIEADFLYDGWQLYTFPGRARVPYLTEAWVGRIRFTNVANQRYVTLREDLFETDLSVVDNRDGTLSGLNFAVDTWVEKDGSGHRLAGSVTKTWARFRFDEAGTPRDRTDDEELAWDVVKSVTHGDEDFCPFTVAAVTGA